MKLTIISKANNKLVLGSLYKNNGELTIKDDEVLVFLDYASHEVPVLTIFDDVKVENIYEYSLSLTHTPMGHKTIAHLKFLGNNHKDSIMNLKEEDSWSYNPNPIVLDKTQLDRDVKLNKIFNETNT